MKRGIGDPIFNKLQSKLAYAMLSIPAVKGFDYGSGFDSVNFYGSKLNDSFYKDYDYDTVRTWTNNSGGIQGGISNGEDIIFRVAFKPTASISKEQNTIDIYGNDIKLKTKGRHDPCVVPRAVPIVESMAALTLINYNIL